MRQRHFDYLAGVVGLALVHFRRRGRRPIFFSPRLWKAAGIDQHPRRAPRYSALRLPARPKRPDALICRSILRTFTLVRIGTRPLYVRQHQHSAPQRAAIAQSVCHLGRPPQAPQQFEAPASRRTGSQCEIARLVDGQRNGHRPKAQPVVSGPMSRASSIGAASERLRGQPP